MKKTIIHGIFILAFILLAGCGHRDTQEYQTSAVIVEAGDTVVAEDALGNLWEFYGDGFSAGDMILMTMNNNGTPGFIYDDQVIDATIG